MMILAVLLCLTLLGPLAVSAFVCLSSGSRILSSEDAAQLQADCILVPGALVRKNGQLSGILADRMTVGIALYHAGASDRMLLSGDHGRADYNEVGAMKDYAAARDVPAETIFLDHAGFSTYESLLRARDEFGVKRIVIVTQRYHLYRALYIAKRLGLDAYGVPSNLHTYAGQLKFSLREIAARNKDFLLTLFPPASVPTGRFPLSGDGTATHG